MGGKLNMTVYLLSILTILTVFDNMAVSGTSTNPGTSTTGIVSTDAPGTETTAPVSLTTSADLLPPAPTVVFVDPLVPLKLNVSWLMPDGRNASSYNISLNGTVSFTTNETYHLIESSLLYGAFYDVGVQACEIDRCSNITTNSSATYPAAPVNLQTIDFGTNDLHLQWDQEGGYESITVMVNYNNCSNVTDGISISPKSAPSDVNSTVNCNITNLPAAGGKYEVVIDIKFMDLKNISQSDAYTRPEMPGTITLFNQTTSKICVSWMQSGIVSYFSVGVNATNSSNYSSKPVPSSSAENENCSGCYNCDWSVDLCISDLDIAGEMYEINVTAVVGDLSSDSQTSRQATAPNAPENFSSSPVSANNILLNWETPAGNAYGYEIVCTDGSSDTKNYANGSSTSFTLTSLSSDCQYTTTIVTRNFNISSCYRTSSNYTFPDIVKNLNVTNITHAEVVVSWYPPDRHINIGCYELMLSNSSGSCLRHVNLGCSNKKNTCRSYPDVMGNCNVSVEKTDCSKSPITYQVAELQSSANYNISVAAWNPGGRGKPDSKRFLTVDQPPSDSSGNSDWIIGVVIGVIFGVLLVLLAFLLFHRWRHDKSPFEKSSEEAASVGGRENPNYEEEPEPISINDFAGHVSKMNQDSNYLFACEYLLLGKLSAKKSTIAAELPDNRTKNRYTDVLPFDDSRVMLVPYNDMGEGDSSDYINASYLPGFNSRREYIAAQGPMRSTVDDFWLMIWQQKVATIIMVTNLVERGREKCEQYWPSDNEPICYGNISVGLKSESTPLDFYTLRVMEISFNSEKRSLTQYHFLTWPDFGVPDKVEDILDFVTEVRGHFRGTAPMLVHCSAGVGRTGTFIVVDHLLQLIRRDMYVDLFHLVLELRQHRPKMIQAESQYIFAHECIKMAISRGYHKRNSMYMAESDPAGENGNCLYVNASDIGIDPLYANAGEIREHPV